MNQENIGSTFRLQAEAVPEKTALIYLGARFSYKELLAMSAAFARSLAELGLGPGDRLMIYLPNCPEWIVAWFGALTAGLAVTPLSPIYPARDLEFAARDSAARAILCSNTNFGYVKQVQDRAGFEQVIWTNTIDLLPRWKKTLAFFFDKTPRGRVSRDKKVIPFSRMLRPGSGRGQLPEPEAADLAAILYTGGTIRTPKGVPYTHELLLDPVRTQLDVSESVIPRGENTILLAAPLFHITGLTFGPGAMALNADTVILMPRLNPDGLMDAVNREKAKSLYAMPSVYRLLLEHDRLDLYDLSSLVYCFSGGDVFPGQTGKRWHERYGVSIGQGYGATETGGGVSLCPPDRENPAHTVGLPLASKRITIVDPETLRPVLPGQAGELLVGSEPMITSYWNRPRETAAAFIELDGLAWYRTGDIMKQDEDGYLYFVDRVSDALIHRGRKVSASQIEVAIQEHPAVTGACVVGVPDGNNGDRIKAYVVLKENQRGISAGDLLAWLAARLPADMMPPGR